MKRFYLKIKPLERLPSEKTGHRRGIKGSGREVDCKKGPDSVSYISGLILNFVLYLLGGNLVEWATSMAMRQSPLITLLKVAEESVGNMAKLWGGKNQFNSSQSEGALTPQV